MRSKAENNESPAATIILTGAPARQLLLALPYLPTSLSVARTRGCFWCGRCAGMPKCRERRMHRSDKSHQNHFALRSSAHHFNAWWATSDWRLPQWICRRHLSATAPALLYLPTSLSVACASRARCTRTYECRECRTHTNGLRLPSSDVQEAQVPRVHGRTGAASARPKGRKNKRKTADSILR
jgi:hypothetical protein